MRTSRDTRQMIDLYNLRCENGTNDRQMDVVTMLVRILGIYCMYVILLGIYVYMYVLYICVWALMVDCR